MSTVTDDIEAAWGEVFDALPAAWSVGRPSYHDERHEWTMYGWDRKEVAKVGVRSKEWTAIGATEVAFLREMACCLREIGAGRASPKRRHSLSGRTL